jgi:hypothetical protein
MCMLVILNCFTKAANSSCCCFRVCLHVQQRHKQSCSTTMNVQATTAPMFLLTLVSTPATFSIHCSAPLGNPAAAVHTAEELGHMQPQLRCTCRGALHPAVAIVTVQLLGAVLFLMQGCFR